MDFVALSSARCRSEDGRLTNRNVSGRSATENSAITGSRIPPDVIPLSVVVDHLVLRHRDIASAGLPRWPVLYATMVG